MLMDLMKVPKLQLNFRNSSKTIKNILRDEDSFISISSIDSYSDEENSFRNRD